MSITTELLDALLSPNGGIRSQAETVLNGIAVTDRVQGFLTILSGTTTNTTIEPRHQLLAAVLLRRDIAKLTDATMLTQLIPPLLQSQASSCRLQVGHCVTEACATLTMVGANVEEVLPGILTFLEASLRQGDLVSIQLLANLADRTPMAFTKLAVPSLPALVPSTCVSPTLMQTWTEAVVNAAIATTVTDVSMVRKTPSLDELKVEEQSAAARLGAAVMPRILGWIASNSTDEDALQVCFQHLSHAAVTAPSLLTAVLDSLTNTCLELAKKPSPELQLSSLQVLASLVSVGDVKRRVLPATMASLIASTALPICAQLMAEGIDDDFQEWALEPATLVEDGMDDDNDQAMFADTLCESFLQHLSSLDVALPLVQRLLESSEWQHSRAGLAMLECGLAATPVSLAPHLPTVVQAAASLAGSENPRVQWQAIRLLGSLCEVNANIRESPVVLERIAAALASPCTKVSAMASLGLVSYCRGDEDLDAAQFVLPYLQDILGALVQGPLSFAGTDTGSVAAKVRAMGATACVAEVSGDSFGPYYPSIMPGLIANAQSPAPEVAGAAVEAATIVGQAVGKEFFAQDAQQLLSWILPVLQSEQSSLPLDQLLSACARIASVLEEDFAPYVDKVLPHLLRRAQQPPDVSIVEGDESGLDSKTGPGELEIDEDEGTESMTVAVPGRGFTKFTINTTKIQEKAQATRAVYEHAKAMGAAFGPYVQTCFDAFLPMVNFQYSADVRSTSAQTLSAVFDAACAHGEHVGMEIPAKYLPLLADTISRRIAREDTSDMEALWALADSLSEIYYIVYNFRGSPLGADILANFSLKNAQQSVERCMRAMVACLERRGKLTKVLSGSLTGDDEREEYQAMLRSEENLLTPLVDSIGYTLKFFRQSFLPIFEKYVVPVLGPALATNTDLRASVSAMCLFDDVVEHCGAEAAAKYSPKLVQGVVVAFQGPFEKDLVQAAVYGVAQMARYAPSTVMSGHIQTIVHQLLSLTSRSKEEAGDDIYLVEIAASALASLTLFGPFMTLKFIGRDSLMNTFLSYLPIQQDEDEAKICHSALCDLVENGAIDLSAEATRMTRIVAEILADVQEGEEIASQETCERLAGILFQMQQQLPQDTMQLAYGSLAAETQNAVGDVLRNYALSRSHIVTP